MSLLVLFLALISAPPVTSFTLYIDNTVPRLDDTGAIMDSHDSSIRPFFDKSTNSTVYYMFSIAYGLCKEPANYGCDQTSDKCGFQYNHTINVWKSSTLASGSWHFVDTAIAESQRPAGVIYRPDGIFNPNTNSWVLYWNFVYPNGTYGGYIAATSPAPEGPFSLQTIDVNVSTNNATWHCGDFHLFIDDDGTPYIIMGCNFHMIIEKLNPDMLSSTGERFIFSEYFIEAPQMFKRTLSNGTKLYYALFAWCCCYCYQGSGVIVHTATSPLGPWTTQAFSEVACVPTANASISEGQSSAPSYLDAALGALPTPGQGCQYNNASTTSALKAQQSFILEVQTPSGPEFIWTGDRWQQSWDGLKGHDPQTWVPIVFNDDGSIQRMNWLDSFTMDILG
jgi:hypothetical protein